MATATQSTLQAKTFSAGLTVDDVQQSLKFFEGLGFAVQERWEEQGQLAGVMLRAGEARVFLTQDDWKKGRDRQKGVGMRLFIETKQNVDEIASRARAAGVKLDSEPHDSDMQTRAFEATEPSGFKITISSEMQPSTTA